MSVLQQLSIANNGLRYKLLLAFSLMTIIPLLACVHLLSPYLTPGSQIIGNLSLTIIIVVIISILGLIIAANIINTVIRLSGDARRIAGGDYERYINLPAKDELGDLGQSINTLTKRIRSSLDELKSYGQNMKEVNAEIEKKVAALSNLLQIDDIISNGNMQIDSLLELGVSKASVIFNTGFGVLYLPREEGGDFIAKVSFNAEKEGLSGIVIKRGGHGVLERIVESRKMVHVCDGMKIPKDLEEFKTAHELKNFIVLPLYSKKSMFGAIVIGNRLSDFTFTRDDIDLVTVFAKHIMIAIENDALEKKNKELAIKDDLTGLFNKRYVLIRLEEEIKRAIFNQKPCAFVVFRIDNFKSFHDANGATASEEIIKRMAKIIRDNNTPIGRAARIGGNEFAMLLPEKNKKQAANIAEDVRKKLMNVNISKEGMPLFQVSAGVSENPIDGTTSDELFRKATTLLGAS